MTPRRWQATFVRWVGPDVRVSESLLRTVEFDFRLAAGREWPRTTRLLPVETCKEATAISARALPPRFEGNRARFAFAIDCTHASPGNFTIWFALSAGEGAQMRFTEKPVVFDEFLVRPDQEMLLRAYRWTLDLPPHQVRPISSALLSQCKGL